MSTTQNGVGPTNRRADRAKLEELGLGKVADLLGV